MPKYLLRDRERIFGVEFSREVAELGIEVLAAPRSPWQRAYVERVIGTIRRECLDNVIVFNEAPVQPLESGAVVALPQVGGIHHRYERRAA